MAPLSSTFAAVTARAFGFMSNLLRGIYDNFSRTTSGSLGTTTSGQLWNAITGVWYANGGVAETGTAASSYPMATVPYETNISATLGNISPGAGIAFWEAGSGDWWVAASHLLEVTTNGSYVCTATGCISTYSTCSSSSCCTGSNTCVSNSCCWTSYQCIEYVPGTTACSLYGYVCVASDCCSGSNTCVASTCCTGCSTCGCNASGCVSGYYNQIYTWSFYLQILKAVAGVVSQVANNLITTYTYTNNTANPPNQIGSIAVTTVGTSAVATAYSDTGLATPIGTTSATNGSVPTGTGVGIALTPVDPSAATYQGNTVGPFSAQP